LERGELEEGERQPEQKDLEKKGTMGTLKGLKRMLNKLKGGNNERERLEQEKKRREELRIEHIGTRKKRERHPYEVEAKV
jgi:hypothetical protein